MADGRMSDDARDRLTMGYEPAIISSPTSTKTVKGPKGGPLPEPGQARSASGTAALSGLLKDWDGAGEPRLRRRSTEKRKQPRDGDGDGFYSPFPGAPDRTPVPPKVPGRLVRKALAGHQTAQQVGDAAAAEARRITGRNIAFDMEGSDPQMAAEHCEGILRSLEKYPDAPLQSVRQGGPAFAYASTNPDIGRITFHAASQRPGYRELLAQHETEGDLAVGTPMGTAMHEFGHIVANGDGANGAIATVAQKLAAAAGMPTSDYVSREISNYATEDTAELGAEAFSDVLANRANASSLSRAIVAAIDDYYAAGGRRLG